MYKKILLAYDGSDAGQKALLDCKDVAQWSQADLHLTRRLREALGLVDIRVLDHLVIGDGEAVSFAERGLL